MKIDIYQEVTEKIMSEPEKGRIPWRCPWAKGGVGLPTNLDSGKQYRGLNSALLSIPDYSSNYWLTYKQACAKGGQVRKGEKGTRIIFWKMLEKENQEAKGGKESIPLLKTYCVFNLDQIEGIEKPSIEPDKTVFSPIEACEKMVAEFALGFAPIRHCGTRAFYLPSDDSITLPDREVFFGSEGYYATLFHEAVHAPGHKSRLNREGVQGSSFFGDEVYSQEELIAEMGSAYICAMAGITNDNLIQNSGAYISSWMAALRQDKKLFFKACVAGQKACDYITNKQNNEK